MLEQLLDLVKDQAAGHFVQNTDVPNEQAQVAATAAGESIMEAIQQQIMSGNTDALQGLLGLGQTGQEQGQGNSDMLNVLIQQASSILSGKLQNQVGVSNHVADNAAGGIIPALIQMVMGKFRSQAPSDSGFDIGSLIGMVLGGGGSGNAQGGNNPLGGLSDILGGGLGNVLGNILGGDRK